MAAEKGSPAWYKEAEQDFIRKRDTEAAREVAAEARALLFGGLTVSQANKALKDKGMGMYRANLIAQAAQQEWNAIVGAASTDFDAGQRDSPHIASARRLALEITRQDPSGGDFRKKLAVHGASDGLAAYLAADPVVNQEANKSGGLMLVAGLVGLGVSVFGAFAVFSAAKPDTSGMGGLAMVFMASVTGVWRGLVGMSRRAGRS